MDINARNSSGQPPLTFLTETLCHSDTLVCGSGRVIVELLKLGTDVTIADVNMNIAFHFVLSQQLIDELIAAEVDTYM